MPNLRVLLFVVAILSLSLSAWAADAPASGDEEAVGLPSGGSAPASSKVVSDVPLPAAEKALPQKAEPEAKPVAAAPKAVEKNQAIPMEGRAGFMLSGRFGTHWRTYGISGSFKYWVFERFAVKPVLTLNHISHSVEGGTSESRYSYGLSNIFQFSPWIGKNTRFNVGVGLGFDFSKITNSDDDVDYTTKCYRVFMPMEMGIEYHIRPWLSWEIGASMDFFQYETIPGSKDRPDETNYAIDLNTARAYTGITLYTN